MYKKFWSMQQVRGLWTTDRYKTRKGQAMQRDQEDQPCISPTRIDAKLCAKTGERMAA